MRSTLLSLAVLCWASGQTLSSALYKYYSQADLAEVREKTPLKYEGLLYEFSESFEVEAPPGTPLEAVAAFIQGLDPRLLERHETEDRLYTIGSYRVLLKSHERCRAELCARHPEACRTASSASEKHLQKVSRP